MRAARELVEVVLADPQDAEVRLVAVDGGVRRIEQHHRVLRAEASARVRTDEPLRDRDGVTCRVVLRQVGSRAPRVRTLDDLEPGRVRGRVREARPRDRDRLPVGERTSRNRYHWALRAGPAWQEPHQRSRHQEDKSEQVDDRPRPSLRAHSQRRCRHSVQPVFSADELIPNLSHYTQMPEGPDGRPPVPSGRARMFRSAQLPTLILR